jgi:hypothetical protein
MDDLRMQDHAQDCNTPCCPEYKLIESHHWPVSDDALLGAATQVLLRRRHPVDCEDTVACWGAKLLFIIGICRCRPSGSGRDGCR